MEGPVELPELEAFDRALEKALDGDRIGAIEKLEDFLSRYPKSNLAEEAQQTLAMLKNPEPAAP